MSQVGDPTKIVTIEPKESPVPSKPVETPAPTPERKPEKVPA